MRSYMFFTKIFVILVLCNLKFVPSSASSQNETADSLYSKMKNNQTITLCETLTAVDVLKPDLDNRLEIVLDYLARDPYCLFDNLSLFEFWKYVKDSTLWTSTSKSNMKTIIKSRFKDTDAIDKDFFFDSKDIVPVADLTFSKDKLKLMISSLDIDYISKNIKYLPKKITLSPRISNALSHPENEVLEWFPDSIKNNAKFDTNTSIALYNMTTRFCDPANEPLLVKLNNWGITTDNIKKNKYLILKQDAIDNLQESDYNYLVGNIVGISQLAMLSISIQAKNLKHDIKDPNLCINVKGFDLSSESEGLRSKILQDIAKYNELCAFSFYIQSSPMYFGEASPSSRSSLFKFGSQCPSNLLLFIDNLKFNQSVDYKAFFNEWFSTGDGWTCISTLVSRLSNIDTISNANEFFTWLLETKISTDIENIYKYMTLDFLQNKILNSNIQNKVILDPIVNRSIFNGIPKDFILRQSKDDLENRNDIGLVTSQGLDLVTWRLSKSIPFHSSLTPFEKNSLSKCNSSHGLDDQQVLQLILDPLELVNPDSFCPTITSINSPCTYNSTLKFRDNRCKTKSLPLFKSNLSELFNLFNNSLGSIPKLNEALDIQIFLEDISNSLSMKQQIPVFTIVYFSREYNLDFSLATSNEIDYLPRMREIVNDPTLQNITPMELEWLIYTKKFYQIALLFYLHKYDKNNLEMENLSISAILDISWLCGGPRITEWYLKNFRVMDSYVKKMIDLAPNTTACYPYNLISQVLNDKSLELFTKHQVHNALLKTIPNSETSISNLQAQCSDREFSILAYNRNDSMRDIIPISIEVFIDNVHQANLDNAAKESIIKEVITSPSAKHKMIPSTNRYYLNQKLSETNNLYVHLITESLVNSLPKLNSSAIDPNLLPITFDMFARYNLMEREIYEKMNSSTLEKLLQNIDSTNLTHFLDTSNASSFAFPFIGDSTTQNLTIASSVTGIDQEDWIMFKALFNRYMDEDDIIEYRIRNMFGALCKHGNLSNIISIKKNGIRVFKEPQIANIISFDPTCHIFKTTDRISLWKILKESGFNIAPSYPIFDQLPQLVVLNTLEKDMFFDHRAMGSDSYEWFKQDELERLCRSFSMSDTNDIQKLVRYLNGKKIMGNRNVTISINPWFNDAFGTFINLYDDVTDILEEFKMCVNGYNQADESYELYAIKKRFKIHVNNETFLLNSRKDCVGKNISNCNSSCHIFFQNNSCEYLNLSIRETLFLLKENPLCGYVSYIHNSDNISLPTSSLNIDEKYCKTHSFASLFNSATNNPISTERLINTSNLLEPCLVTIINTFKLNNVANYEYMYHLILKRDLIFNSISDMATGSFIREISLLSETPSQRMVIKKLSSFWSESKLVDSILLDGYLNHCSGSNMAACEPHLEDLKKLLNLALLHEDSDKIKREGIIGTQISKLSDGRPKRFEFPQLWTSILSRRSISSCTSCDNIMLLLQKCLAKLTFENYRELNPDQSEKFDLLFKHYEHIDKNYYENLNITDIDPIYRLKLDTASHEAMLKGFVDYLYNTLGSVIICNNHTSGCPKPSDFQGAASLQGNPRNDTIKYLELLMKKFKNLSNSTLMFGEFVKTLKIEDIPKRTWESHEIYHISTQVKNSTNIDAVWKTFLSLGYVIASIDYEIPLIKEVFDSSKADYHSVIGSTHPLTYFSGVTDFSFIIWYMEKNINMYKNIDESFSGTLLNDYALLANMPDDFFLELFRDNTNDLLKKRFLDNWDSLATNLFRSRPNVLTIAFLAGAPLGSLKIYETLLLTELQNIISIIKYGAGMNELEMFISSAAKYENTNPIRIGELVNEDPDKKFNVITIDEAISRAVDPMEKDIWQRLRPFAVRIKYDEFSLLSRDRKWDYFFHSYPENPKIYDGASVWELVFKDNNTDYLNSTKYWMPLTLVCKRMKADGFKIGTAIRDPGHRIAKEHITYVKDKYLDPNDIDRDKMKDALDALEAVSSISTTGIPPQDFFKKRNKSNAYLTSPYIWLSFATMILSIISF